MHLFWHNFLYYNTTTDQVIGVTVKRARQNKELHSSFVIQRDRDKVCELLISFQNKTKKMHMYILT